MRQAAKVQILSLFFPHASHHAAHDVNKIYLYQCLIIFPVARHTALLHVAHSVNVALYAPLQQCSFIGVSSHYIGAPRIPQSATDNRHEIKRFVCWVCVYCGRCDTGSASNQHWLNILCLQEALAVSSLKIDCSLGLLWVKAYGCVNYEVYQ